MIKLLNKTVSNFKNSTNGNANLVELLGYQK